MNYAFCGIYLRCADLLAVKRIERRQLHRLQACRRRRYKELRAVVGCAQRRFCDTGERLAPLQAKGGEAVAARSVESAQLNRARRRVIQHNQEASGLPEISPL